VSILPFCIILGLEFCLEFFSFNFYFKGIEISLYGIYDLDIICVSASACMLCAFVVVFDARM
jgi:hypothetical protein